MKHEIFLILCATILLLACQPKDKSNWESEEILLQLAEIKTSIAGIKKQQQSITARLEELEKNKPIVNKPKIIESISLKYRANEKVAIVEFTDYQCPYCARHAKQVLPKIKANFIDKGLVHYEVRDYPLGFHSKAKMAAVAALCVPQNKKMQMEYKKDNPYFRV